MAEALPALLHVPLFLFFAALGDYVLEINTTVGLGIVIHIGISGLFCLCHALPRSHESYTRAHSISPNTLSLALFGIRSRGSMDEPPLPLEY